MLNCTEQRRCRSRDKKLCDNKLGRALKFYATIRIEVRRAEAIKKGNDIVGNKTKIKIVKNKVAPPFRTAEVDVMYGEGISYEGSLVSLGDATDVIQKSGSWYSYKDERLGQGAENVKAFFKENPTIAREIEGKIRAALNMAPPFETIVTEVATTTDETTNKKKTKGKDKDAE